MSDPPDYRYTLGRRLRSEAIPDPSVLFIMLNPSTADHWKNDPTIKRCIKFADSWGYRVLRVCNLFAFRSTSPDNLFNRAKQQNIIGPENDEHILREAERSDLIVCAWGALGTYEGRSSVVLKMLGEAGHDLHALGTTKDGHPRHPLYVPAWMPLENWKGGKNVDR
jgi:hypothetical protein